MRRLPPNFLRLIWLSSILIAAVSARVLYVPVPIGDTSHHEFKWVTSNGASDTFMSQINASTKTGDSFWIVTGDTQYWVKCTPMNYECHSDAGWCDTRNATCQRKHGEFANRAQKTSITALIRRLRQGGNEPKGVIINGDLTEFGHQHELDEYNNYWPGVVERVRIYPGLGNHDYANNINNCGFNHCANRMLQYFYDYVRKHLRLPMHVMTRMDGIFSTVYTGSLAYSWDDCTPNGTAENCIHFVQLNHYPTYVTRVDFLFGTNQWNIQSALGWLRADLNHTNHPVVINFHDFDTKFSFADKMQLQQVLQDSNRRILGIFFAHYHSSVGLHPSGHWCLNGQGQNNQATPLMYSGSIPGNNYLLVHFSDRTMKSVYALHTGGDNQTTARKVNYFDRC